MIAYYLLVLHYISLIVVLIIVSFAHNIIITTTIARIATESSYHQVAFAFGCIETLNALSYMIGNALFGYLCELTNDCSVGYQLLLVLSFGGSLLALIMAIDELKELCCRWSTYIVF
jgi:MFS family permease